MRGLSTATAVLAAVRPLGAAVKAGALVLPADPPESVLRALAVLHTGVRAVLSGLPWYGCGSTPADASPRRLAVDSPIPLGITLLCVEGDERWHRVPADAREKLPHLFVAPPKPKAKPAATLTA